MVSAVTTSQEVTGCELMTPNPLFLARLPRNQALAHPRAEINLRKAVLSAALLASSIAWTGCGGSDANGGGGGGTGATGGSGGSGTALSFDVDTALPATAGASAAIAFATGFGNTVSSVLDRVAAVPQARGCQVH